MREVEAPHACQCLHQKRGLLAQVLWGAQRQLR